MLFELQIKDFILIKEATITFDQGLNIMTGETGAGKSMVLGAIDLLLGSSANKELVRIGSDKALIKGSFYTNDEVNRMLQDFDCPFDETIIVVSREVQNKGKSIARINGTVVTVSQLKSISERLLNIHGQSENQVLLVKEHQLKLLDSYGGNALLDIRSKVFELYKQYKDKKDTLNKLLEKSSQRQKQIDFLKFQINEIEEAALKTNEDSQLENEFVLLTHLDTIILSSKETIGWLNGDEGEGAVSKLSRLSGLLSRYASHHEKLGVFSDRLKEAYYNLEDLSYEMNHFLDDIEGDPERLMAIEKRLDTINRLKSKYGNSIPLILEKCANSQRELEEYEGIEDKIAKLQLGLNEIEKEYLIEAKKLRTARVEVAKLLEKALVKQLKELNMKESQLEIQFEQLEHFTSHGIDAVDMLIATNLGQPFRSLKKVVSGGELSRIMLGLKIVLGQSDTIPTLVFDEIDAGISGVTANVVGEKLCLLASECQVICITHLPQIAVYADHHLLIQKVNCDNETITQIDTINSKEVTDEISRLVGGTEVTDSTEVHAKEMLLFAGAKKQSIRQ